MAASPIRIFSGVRVPEGSAAEYEATFVGADAAETVLVPNAVTSILATLTTKAGAIVNGRDDQEVKNAAGGTLDAAGIFTLRLSGTADHVRLTSDAIEERRLTLVVTYQRLDGNPDRLTHEIRYFIYDLAQVG